MFGMDSTKAKSQEHIEPDMNSNLRAVDSHKNNRLRKTLSTLFARQEFSSWSYVFFFCLFNLFAIFILQWAVSSNRATDNALRFLTDIFRGNFRIINGFLLLGLVYFIVLILINRFWIASQIFVTLSAVLAVIEKFKIVSRTETIVPSDLDFVTGGNAQNLAARMPYNAVSIISVLAYFCLLLLFL